MLHHMQIYMYYKLVNWIMSFSGFGVDSKVEYLLCNAMGMYEYKHTYICVVTQTQ